MIYFARPDQSSRVKIGFTAGAPSDRLAHLQTACPTRLRLIGAMAGDEAVERWLHDRFAADRLEGEWFRMSADLAWVAASCNAEFLLLAGREPRLIDLVRRIGAESADCVVRCRITAWFGYDLPDGEDSLDHRMCDLVGWQRKREPEAVRRGLHTSEVYDFTYRVLSELLPECNGMPCGCETE